RRRAAAAAIAASSSERPATTRRGRSAGGSRSGFAGGNEGGRAGASSAAGSTPSGPAASGEVNSVRGLAQFLDAGRLALAVTQVVELRATDVTARGDLDLLHGRGVHGEDALDADAEGELAHAEGLA